MRAECDWESERGSAMLDRKFTDCGRAEYNKGSYAERDSDGVEAECGEKPRSPDCGRTKH